MDMQLPRHPLDKEAKDGWDGKFYASHAEAILLAFYLDFYIKHSEALHSLGTMTNWDTQILAINVSDDVCPTCLEIARRMYEKHQITVNFTIRGHVVHPEYADFFYDTIEAISQIPSRGLHLYREAALSESKLTVIIPYLRTSEFADTIDGCIEDAIRDNRLDDQPCLKVRARKAVFNFIESMKMPELTQAIDRFDDFPWKNVVPAPEEAFRSEQSALSIGDIAHGLDQLLIDDHNSPQFTSHFLDDSGDSSDDINSFEGEPGWGGYRC